MRHVRTHGPAKLTATTTIAAAPRTIVDRRSACCAINHSVAIPNEAKNSGVSVSRPQHRPAEQDTCEQIPTLAAFAMHHPPADGERRGQRAKAR